MTDRCFMAEHGARLADNGYPVIPIMPASKVPGRFRGGAWQPYPGWARHCDRATTSAEIEIWSRWPGCGIGIATGSVVGLDIDVTDAALAIELTDLATTMLGETPCWRIGRAPKRLLVYRAESAFPGRKRHPIELLARGQQFVAHAIHPDTGQPYAWPEASLLDVPLDRLPAVDEARCHAFLEAASALVPAEARTASLLPQDAASRPCTGPGDPKGTGEAIAAALAWLPNDDLPGNEWITIGNAIKAALGEDGRDLWLDWSRQSRKSGQSGRADTPERRWAGFRPHSVGAGTIYQLAIDRGWVPEPGIILNGSVTSQMAQPHPAAALLARAEATPQPAPEPTPYRVPRALLEVDGVLRMFIDYATRTAVSPQPFLALGAAICLVGAVAGRRYRTPTDLRSNVYAVGIADSGGGKDHARRCVKRALYAAGLDRYLGGEDLASSAGLLTSLQRHPARLFQVDEFGQFLKLVLAPRAPAHKAAIWAELTKLYTSAAEPYIGAEYADQKARPRVTIEQPCACIWGVTVPAPFWHALESGALADGSMARFLVFLTDEHYPARQDAPEPADPPAELLAALAAVAAGAGGHDHGGNLADAMQSGAAITPYTVPLTPAAETAMATARQHAIERLRAHQGTYATALFGRHAENTAKLAMLAAISRNPVRPVTEEHDVTWGHRLVDHCIGTLLREADRHVAETPAHARLKKVLDVIRSAGRIRRTEFTRRTQSLSKHERDDAIATLLDSKQIAIETAPNASGPDTTWIIAIEPEEGLKSHAA